MGDICVCEFHWSIDCIMFQDDRIFDRVISDISVVLRETSLTISNSNESVSPVEFEIVRVVSLSTTEITETIRFEKPIFGVNIPYRRFQRYFSYITEASAPIHTFLEFLNQHILSKPLATFTHNHRRKNGPHCEKNESCHHDDHQSSERILAELNKTKNVLKGRSSYHQQCVSCICPNLRCMYWLLTYRTLMALFYTNGEKKLS